MHAIRHGDVVLVKVREFDPGRRQNDEFREEDGVVLAEGEITGHTHQLHSNTADPLIVSESRSAQFGEGWFLEIPEGGATLTHEEHDTIPLDPGKWIAFNQREAWTDRSARQGWNSRQVYD